LTRIITTALLSIIACTFFVGCYNSNTDEAEKTTLCFRNENSHHNMPTLKDIEELNLFLKNGKVIGTYNWLPAEKDKRKGSLSGSINTNIIKALYTFEQEGIKDTTLIKIVLLDNKAIITGGSLELGLNTTIDKIDCTLSAK
jgi:hypothetical protein